MVSYSSSGGGSISTAKGKAIGSPGSFGSLGSLPSMEGITRPAAADDVLQRFVERAEKRRPPVDDSGEADLRWGEPSRFSLVQAEAPTNPSFTVNNSGGEEDPVPPEAEILQFTEVQKALEEVRVENPDDPDQYIITKRRVWSIFSGPDGIYRQFNWDNSDLDA